ncbi:hypothetical protein DFA_06880 [Cavenderia fasciculata]|uniref:Uncharacterized protein n=1 Tax=Cavenderia fasciculata TaxID=261658 RepID=F4PWX6_CACFS|nr:uncharacterized protein DFA_06880 [Cavenderia fasciculata]EGG19779.1 hypothetical protein DFA_06880 [Cavenderia fasciculata]|eukprot:XP_004358125.1 hypothetical protein DFA_06880 [Cavenderia fasciculata]
MEKITDGLHYQISAETVHISSLPLLKMLQHEQGVPLEVMES